MIFTSMTFFRNFLSFGQDFCCCWFFENQFTATFEYETPFFATVKCCYNDNGFNCSRYSLGHQIRKGRPKPIVSENIDAGKKTNNVYIKYNMLILMWKKVRSSDGSWIYFYEPESKQQAIVCECFKVARSKNNVGSHISPETIGYLSTQNVDPFTQWLVLVLNYFSL